MQNRMFPQGIDDIAIDRELLAQLRSQWSVWRSLAANEPADFSGEIALTPGATAEIRTVAGAVTAIGRQPELQVPPDKDAERYLAFIKRLEGYPRVQALWEEERGAELRRYEWATLRDVALLAGELDKRDREAALEWAAESEAETAAEVDEYDDAATLAGRFDAAGRQPDEPLSADPPAEPTASASASAPPGLALPGLALPGLALPGPALPGLALPGPALPPRCVEIGGGFGRLSDGMLHLFEGRAKAVVVEADPAALAASHAYLSARWPDLRAKICTARLEAPDLDNADILVVPWWHLGNDALTRQADVLADLAGIEALDEAELSEHLAFVDRAAATCGLLYFMPSRDRGNPRDYTYPPTWQLRYKRRTPWSESPDHPVEIYLQTGRDHRAVNRRADLAYLRTVVRQYRIERLAAQHMAERQQALRTATREQGRARLAELAAALKAQRDRNARLAERNDRLTEQLEKALLEAEETRSAALEFLEAARLSQQQFEPALSRDLDRALLRLQPRAR